MRATSRSTPERTQTRRAEAAAAHLPSPADGLAHSIDRDVGVPARGWHGEAYRGHIFWDELFIFPFLSLRLPMLTRALLRYRYRRLPEAARRGEAPKASRGRCFPGRAAATAARKPSTCTSTRCPGAGSPTTAHRQRHINAAIAYNIWQYYQATDDHEFLYYYGAELFLEIARFWAAWPDLQRRDRPLRDQGRDGARRVPHRLSGGRSRRRRAGSTTTPTPTSWVVGADAGSTSSTPSRAARSARKLCEALGLIRRGAKRGTRSAASCACRFTRRHHQPVRRLREAEGIRLGRAIARNTATSTGSTASSRPRATT
jgi:hypothetical protein